MSRADTPPSLLQASDEGRNRALDGLRGLAALVVVLHHLTLTNGWFALRVFRPTALLPQRPWESARTLLEFSPLHAVFAGTEAVIIFFVLSGLVLVRSVRSLPTRAYGISRLVRLYLPIWASVAVSLLLALGYVTNHHVVPSWWLQSRLQRITWTDVVGNLWLVDGNTWLNSVYWSMKYELIFSVLLPVVLWPALTSRRSTRTQLAQFAGLVALVAVGAQVNLGLLEYLPMFFLGVLLADVPAPVRREGFLAVGGLLLLTAPWSLAGFGVATSPGIAMTLTVTGATALVQSARGAGVVSKLLSLRPVRFLGTISFSLYLVHNPIVVLTWLRLGSGNGASVEILRAGVALVASLVVATAFNVLVERRAISLARRVRTTLGGRA